MADKVPWWAALLGRVAQALLMGVYAGVGVAGGFGYDVLQEDAGRFWFAVSLPTLATFITSLIPRPVKPPQ